VTFTITATNSAGTDPKDYTVAVAAAAVAPSITTDSLPAATVGAPYSATVTATGTGPITFTVSSGALPDGLVLDPSTGVVSGTPTSAGSVTFTITATNSAGTDAKTYTVAVAAAPVLAFTGFDVLLWGVGGVLSLLVGAVLLVLVAKYRRSHAA
jgi:PKD repeat protein